MIDRKQLLPLWVRFSSWIFLLFLVSPLVLIVSIIRGYTELSLFGIYYHGPVMHPLPIFMILVMTFHGIVAYGLLWSKRWGVNSGIACGVIGAALSVMGMVSAYTRGKNHFEFSVIIQVLFLIELFNVRNKWLMPEEELHSPAIERNPF